MPTFAFFDIEGTLATGNTWSRVVRHPLMPRNLVRWTYVRVMPLWFGKRVGLVNDLAFRDRWVRIMARLFAGFTREQVESVFRDVAAEIQYNEDVVGKLRQHVQNGDQVLLASGIFEEGAHQIALHLGARAGVGTRLEYHNGTCTGRLSSETCAAERKVSFIQQYLSGHSLNADFSTCFAYADSASDLPLLKSVGYPVATHPEPKLREAAQSAGWTVFPT